MSGQQARDPAVTDVQQFGEIAVGEQSPLLVGLLAQAEGLAQQPLRSREAFDAELHVFGGREVQEHGDQLGVDPPLVPSGRIRDTDGHPEDWAMLNVVLGPLVFDDDFQDDIST
jgi:hypothetical protein